MHSFKTDTRAVSVELLELGTSRYNVDYDNMEYAGRRGALFMLHGFESLPKWSLSLGSIGSDISGRNRKIIFVLSICKIKCVEHMI